MAKRPSSPVEDKPAAATGRRELPLVIRDLIDSDSHHGLARRHHVLESTRKLPRDRRRDAALCRSLCR